MPSQVTGFTAETTIWGATTFFNPKSHTWSTNAIEAALKSRHCLPRKEADKKLKHHVVVTVHITERRNLKTDWELWAALECLGERLEISIEIVFNGDENEREIRRPYIALIDRGCIQFRLHAG